MKRPRERPDSQSKGGNGDCDATIIDTSSS